MSVPYTHADPVAVSLADLESSSVPHSTLLRAFGPTSLGILVVTSLPPKFTTLRHKLLSYATHLAHLPSSVLRQLEAPDADYLVGWSHGRETLVNNTPDTLKGSYYVNCAFYVSPTLDGAEDPEGKYKGFSAYTAGNVWPDEKELESMRGYKDTFQELCKLIIDIAVLVARGCDSYAEKEIEGYARGYLEHVVTSSTTTKARLLHYFPPSADAAEDADWCGTHLDHGCLTGLTSAMYVDESSYTPGQELVEVPSPDKDAGLYIHDRSGGVVKVGIPREALAFQTGEALERITRGKFKAVPHFVKGTGKGVGEVARNTLAVFTQPNLYAMVDEKTDFAAFAKAIVDRNTNKQD